MQACRRCIFYDRCDGDRPCSEFYSVFESENQNREIKEMYNKDEYFDEWLEYIKENS